MITCPECKRPVPEDHIACPGCVAKRGESAVRRRQYEPLLLIEAGRAHFNVFRMPTGYHPRMIDSPLSFCGMEVKAGPKHRYQLNYEDVRICPACRKAIEEILAEARAQAVMETTR